MWVVYLAVGIRCINEYMGFMYISGISGVRCIRVLKYLIVYGIIYIDIVVSLVRWRLVMCQVLESCLDYVRVFGMGCRVGVVGSREFGDMEMVSSFVESLFGLGLDVVLVSGGCRGVDLVGEKIADDLGMRKDIMKYKGEYKQAGGMIRNGELVSRVDVLVVFWDGKSSGSLDVYNKGRKCSGVKVYRVVEEVGDLVQGSLF